MAKAGPPRGRMMGVKFLCLLLFMSAAGVAEAQVSVTQMLTYKPRQEGVQIETPTKDEHAACEVKLVTGAQRGSSGWLLLNARKQPLRKFFDSNGDKKIDQWCYYRNGDEVYREVDSNFNDRPDQYRWYNTGGMKWGVDTNEDGKIDGWKMISAEEAAQEAFTAVATKDFNRLRLLFINDVELQALRLPAVQAERVRGQLQQASSRFEAATAKVPATVKPESVHIEAAPPQCWPADSFGGEQDLLRYPTRTVVFEVAPGKHEWLQTGEMVQVGPAWRLLAAPSIGQLDVGPKGGNPKIQGLMEQLADLDKTISEKGMEDKAAMAKYYLTRAGVVQQLVTLTQGVERETWFKQLADNLSAAAQNTTDKEPMEQLTTLRDQLVKSSPGSNMAGYLTYRVLMADYGKIISTTVPKDYPKVQATWQEKLANFVKDYPRADDTPDALLQLGMGSEFSGKEDEAKRWYKQLVTTFPQHQLAVKAEGATRRLELVDREMPLAGKTLTGASFDLASLKGKVVLVYYWASYCSMCESDFPKIKKLHDSLNAKGFEIVSVNLDEKAADGLNYLQRTPLPGNHLHSIDEKSVGLSSPLAMQYGIMGLPSLFLIGKDGKVIYRTIQTNELEDAIKKAL